MFTAASFHIFFYLLVDPIENGFTQSAINKDFIIFLKTNVGYLTQIALENMQLLALICCFFLVIVDKFSGMCLQRNISISKRDDFSNFLTDKFFKN